MKEGLSDAKKIRGEISFQEIIEQNAAICQLLISISTFKLIESIDDLTLEMLFIPPQKL